jgi:hypothetical protein
MRSSRRVPTGVLVLMAVAVVAAGATWWVRSAPETTSRATSGGAVVLLQLEDGSILTYGTGSSAFDGGDDQLRDLQQIISSDWPCRPDESGGRPPNLMDDQGLEFIPADGVQVIRLPRCSAESRRGR